MQAPDEPAPWWRGAALYQVYPRSFADSNGDGIGDLAGITTRLPYIASLGVDGVWISPFFASPMRDFGYDVSDHRAVDPMFGTLADFDALVAEAHRLGLKVVIDQVWSHTAAEHPWFEESRASRDNAKADWYVWADARPDGSPPNNWQSWMGGPAWRWEPRRRQYHLHNFLPQMPDLNFHCPAVQDEMLAVARFWLERGVDGFRLDTANLYFHSRGLEDNPPAPAGAELPVLMQLHRHNADQPEAPAFFERLRPLLDAHDAFAVAEVGGAEPLPTMAEYTRGRSRLHTAYSFALLGDAPSPQALARHMADWQQGPAAEAWPSWAFSNHDVPRVASRWGGQAEAGFAFGGGAAASATPAGSPALWMALLLVLRGTVFVYQGEELGLPQAEVPFEQLQDPFGRANWPVHKGRDGCRTPMPWLADHPAGGFTSGRPWLPLAPAHLACAVDRQEADPGSLLHLARRLLALRRAHPALRLGDFETLHADAELLLLRRTHGADRVLAAFNLGPTETQHRLGAAPPTRGDTIALHGATLQGAWLRLPPGSALILPLHAQQPTLPQETPRMTDLDSPYPLTAEHVAAFRRDGFVKLKQVLSPETLAHFGAEITRLTIALNTQHKPLAERSTYDRAFLQVMNLWEHSEAVKRFVLGQRLGRIAAGLLEVAGVRLYHDQSLYKEPGGGITPAHADQYYWPLASDRTVTAWIPLQPVPEDMGPLGFWARSQSVAFGRDLGISDESEAKISANMARHGFEFASGPFELGEVSFHLGWTFHKAGANRSPRPRSVMTVIYMDANMHMAPALSAAQANDAAQWCPGVQPGEPIVSPKNPLVWAA